MRGLICLRPQKSMLMSGDILYEVFGPFCIAAHSSQLGRMSKGF